MLGEVSGRRGSATAPVTAQPGRCAARRCGRRAGEPEEFHYAVGDLGELQRVHEQHYELGEVVTVDFPRRHLPDDPGRNLWDHQVSGVADPPSAGLTWPGIRI